jgi:hypothetical protein
VKFTNVMPDSSQFCFNLNQWYTQKSQAYVTLKGQKYLLPYKGWLSDDWPKGAAYSVDVQCCYFDGCIGNMSCQTQSGSAPCICLAAKKVTGTVNACGTVDVPVCN